MSNPRRGLLAAGLTAAVVGSMGVVWTLNASAAETAPAEIPAAAPAEPEPPALLPWGAPPEELELAKPGANSEAVAAAGADAAAADTSGSLEPEAEYALKGRYFDDGSPLKGQRVAVPPTPPTLGFARAKAKAEEDPIIHYAAADITGETDGTWANLTIEKPVLHAGDYHTLAEIAVRSGDEKHLQTIEVGWTVDPSVNGDSDPHLFVFHWVDGVAKCYNGCGFVLYSGATIKPGATLPVGESKRFGIQHSAGVWWIAYDSAWIGYYPDSIWGGRYTKGGYTQWYGEVASPVDYSCSQMGNGQAAAKETAARIGSISMVNGPEVKPAFWLTNSTANAEKEEDRLPPHPGYTIDVRSDRTFRFGGPGATTNCTK